MNSTILSRKRSQNTLSADSVPDKLILFDNAFLPLSLIFFGKAVLFALFKNPDLGLVGRLVVSCLYTAENKECFLSFINLTDFTVTIA